MQIGFCGLLTILFIALKLMGYIAWSWLWVLAPLWVWIALILLFYLLVLAIVVLGSIFGKVSYKS